MDTPPDEESDGMSFKRYAIIAAIVGFVPILLVFVIGFGLAIFADPVPTAERISSIRDVVIIVIFFEMFLIVIALVALVLQIGRLVSTVQGELKPMIQNTREATETVKGTARFVSKNVAQPIISLGAVLAGVLAFARELGGIRRAIRRSPPEGDGNGS